jgi:WD40 repeat protein
MQRTRRLALAALAAAAVTVGLAACETKLTTNAAGNLCPGPDAFSKDGRWVLGSGSSDPSPVRLYDQTGSFATKTLAANGYGADVSGGGGVVLYFDATANRAKLWRRSTNSSTNAPVLKAGTIAIPNNMSTDATQVLLIAAPSLDSTIGVAYLWTPSNGQTLPVAGGASVTDAALSGNGRYVVYSDAAHRVRRWDRTTGTTVIVATASSDNPYPTQAVSDDGRFVVYDATGNGPLRIWDGTTSTSAVAPVGSLGSNYLSVDLDADGSVIVLAALTTNDDYTVRRIVRTSGASTTVFTGAFGGDALSDGSGDHIAYCHSSGAETNPKLDIYVWSAN